MLSEKELQQLNWSTSGKKREKEKKRKGSWEGGEGVREQIKETTCPCKQRTATASLLAFTLTGWMKKDIFCYQIFRSYLIMRLFNC